MSITLGTAAALGTLAGGAGKILDYGMQHVANRYQRAWVEKMDNSKYQRAVQDMQKAGLNPAMMYGSGGASASMPSTGMPTIHGGTAESIGNTMNSIANVANSFNKDQNKKNDLTLGQIMKAAEALSKLSGG